mmetsp:Transcript_2668/g.6261  ORF Transcript_2668/g.6261 Transcript_2668/m.6261 type:complete len:256 (+) Transcript_2668:85-852(+)
MGCYGSKREPGEANDKPPWNPAQPHNVAPAQNQQQLRLPWAAEATKWRWLLRTSQSSVAATLYVFSSWLRLPSRPVWLQIFLSLVLVLPFSYVYHWLSMNSAGGYYDTFAQMYARVPQYLETISRRDSFEYQMEIERERRSGIVRMVDGLESGLVFLLVSLASLTAAGVCGLASGNDGSDFASSWPWRFSEWTIFFAVHRLIGANIFEGRHWGLLQPEALWQFDCILAEFQNPEAVSVSVDCRMKALEHHPNPSY